MSQKTTQNYTHTLKIYLKNKYIYKIKNKYLYKKTVIKKFK